MPQKDLRHCNYYRKRTTSRVGKQGSCFAPVKEGDTNNRFGLPGWAKIPDLRASGSRRRPEGFVRESDPQLQALPRPGSPSQPPCGICNVIPILRSRSWSASTSSESITSVVGPSRSLMNERVLGHCSRPSATRALGTCRMVSGLVRKAGS